MAVKKIDEIMTALKSRIGDSTDDETLAFIEDVQDTLSDFDTRTKDATDWKAKYETNDAEWRQKYRDRFFNTGSEQNQEEESEEPERLTFDSLFKTE